MTAAMTLGLEGLNLTETPSCFSLMPGETLVRAIRAVDAVQKGLAAGALVSRSGGRAHDLWLSDLDEAQSSARYKWETGAGSKLQVRGATRILDALFLEHLQRGGTSVTLSVLLADAGALASARAARTRGFMQQLSEGSGLLFDSGVGSAAYTALAIKKASSESESVAILGHLSAERERARFNANSSFKMGDWDGAEATLLAGVGGEGAGEAPRLLGGLLTAQQRDDLAAFARSLPFSTEPDSVDLLPSEHCMLFESGELLPLASAWAPVLLPLIGRVQEYVRVRGGVHAAVVTDVFVRRYREPAPEARATIPAHWDSLAERTAVIELESADSGGLYLQLCAHASCRRYVDLRRAGDMLLHDWSVQHGVDVRGGERVSLVLWLSGAPEHEEEGGAADEWVPPAWLLRAAGLGDATAEYSLGSLLEGRAEEESTPPAWLLRLAARGNAAAEYSVGRVLDGRGGVAQQYYELAAAQGDPWAATRLGSRCELGLAPEAPEKAAGWWRRAAVKGGALAQEALAEATQEGRLGASKDAALAQTLAVLAAQQG